jgi:nitrate reductase cytochrome c-type subunit
VSFLTKINFKKTTKLAVLLVLIVFTGAVVFAMPNHGKEEINIDGGKKGNIDFPHRIHQDILGDCNICHAVFPQKPGIIKELKAQKKLKKRQVMTKICLNCHKSMKKAGKETGPTNCSQCHVK